jgi:hypothetical protein
MDLTATLTANKPPRAGSQREDLYLYNVIFKGETIVSNSRVPECDAARFLLAKGITGQLTMLDSKTGKPRTSIDIEKAAKLTVLENERSSPRFVKWSPWPEIAHKPDAAPATAAEEIEIVPTPARGRRGRLTPERTVLGPPVRSPICGWAEMLNQCAKLHIDLTNQEEAAKQFKVSRRSVANMRLITNTKNTTCTKKLDIGLEARSGV